MAATSCSNLGDPLLKRYCKTIRSIVDQNGTPEMYAALLDLLYWLLFITPHLFRMKPSPFSYYYLKAFKKLSAL